jgi:hypothetical protein
VTAADTSLQELLERHPEPARPRIVGIAATHPRALARPRLCPCADNLRCCFEVDAAGRTPTGAHCKAHLVDTLEIA